MTEKLDLVCQHASKDRGAATAGRVAKGPKASLEENHIVLRMMGKIQKTSSQSGARGFAWVLEITN
jgi:hypothetical protein